MTKAKYKILNYPASCVKCEELYAIIPKSKSQSVDSLRQALKEKIVNKKSKTLRIPEGMAAADLIAYLDDNFDAALSSTMIIENLSIKKKRVGRKVVSSNAGVDDVAIMRVTLRMSQMIALALAFFLIGLSVIPAMNYIKENSDKKVIASMNSVVDSAHATNDEEQTQSEPQAQPIQPIAQEKPGVVTKSLVSIEDTYRISFGKKASPEKTFHVFVDPNCPRCREAEKEIAKLVARGYNVIQYPVAVVSQKSEADVGTIVCNGDDAAKTMIKIMTGNQVEPKTCSYASAAVENNNKFFFGMGLDRVPAIIHGSTGNVKIGIESADAIEAWIK